MKSKKLPDTENELQVSVRLRDKDLAIFRKVKRNLENPNSIVLDNAEVLRCALRNVAKSLGIEVA